MGVQKVSIRANYLLLGLGILFSFSSTWAQKKSSFCVTGYFAGRTEYLDSFPVGKLTHIIFSFGHLKGNHLSINNAGDTATIRKMVLLKRKYPELKVILSLGGWGGCKDCSDVFSTEKGRKEFAMSVKNLTDYYKTDGIDLDWEYPSIQGYPGHKYQPADRENFTALIIALRKALGRKKEISFAAGGFDQFVNNSIEWEKVMKVADKVYVMSYDLIHGFSRETGHHTPLYSTSHQSLSADHAIKLIKARGVAPGKIVIGAAFYARMFQVNDTVNHGLYRPGSFYRGVSYSRLYDSISADRGFLQFRDEEAKASYAFNSARKIFVTYDDQSSIAEKTRYAVNNRLGGIMFWQLMDDRSENGLLQAIKETLIKIKN
jgi:chitinase